MNEQQVVELIGSLSTTIPSLVALYKQVTANREGVKSIQDLLADADAQYAANIAQLESEK